jgi:hypothetical protein
VHAYGTLKAVEVILRRTVAEMETNGGEEPNRGTICVDMQVSQQNPYITTKY